MLNEILRFARNKDNEERGGGAGMKKELKALKCKGYFNKCRAHMRQPTLKSGFVVRGLDGACGQRFQARLA